MKEMERAAETCAVAERGKVFWRAMPELTLGYAADSNFLDQEGIMVLTEWLMNTAPGMKLRIIGYSGNRGPDEANQRLAYLRAHFVQWFIEKYFSHKELVLSTGHVVVGLAGGAHGKVEVYCTLNKSPARKFGH